MINLCPNGKDYFTQLNNEQDPKIACQATAAAQCISIVDDVTLLRGDFRQPEDNLRAFCKTPDLLNFCIRSHGPDWYTHVSHPSEWADVLVMAINRLMGYQCARYEAYLTPSVMLEDLEKGLPVQASMRFTGISGHYVSVVGVTDEMKWIINDPYRDWLHNGPCGFNVLYTQKDWSDHAKGYGIRYSRRVVEREAA